MTATNFSFSEPHEETGHHVFMTVTEIHVRHILRFSPKTWAISGARSRKGTLPKFSTDLYDRSTRIQLESHIHTNILSRSRLRTEKAQERHILSITFTFKIKTETPKRLFCKAIFFGIGKP